MGFKVSDFTKQKNVPFFNVLIHNYLVILSVGSFDLGALYWQLQTDFLFWIQLKNNHGRIRKFAVFGAEAGPRPSLKCFENRNEVGWYMRSVYAVEHLKKEHHNPNYLSSVEFNLDQLKLGNDINEMVAYADYLIFAIPSAFVEEELKNNPRNPKRESHFSAIKGIVPESSLIVGDHFTPTTTSHLKISGSLPSLPRRRSGPSNAFSYLTIACADEKGQNHCQCSFLRIHQLHDQRRHHRYGICRHAEKHLRPGCWDCTRIGVWW